VKPVDVVFGISTEFGKKQKVGLYQRNMIGQSACVFGFEIIKDRGTQDFRTFSVVLLQKKSGLSPPPPLFSHKMYILFEAEGGGGDLKYSEART